MAETLNTPSALSQPIAQSGDKNTIPVTNDQSLGLMSQSTGFPPICSQRIVDGGKAPRRADFNGIFNLLSQQHFFLQNGGSYTFRQDVSDAIGGYPLNAMLFYVDSSGNVKIVRSMIQNNTFNFVSTPSYIDDGVHWETVIPTKDWVSETFVNLTGNQNVGGNKNFTGNLTKDSNQVITKSPEFGSKGHFTLSTATEICTIGARKFYKANAGLAYVSIFKNTGNYMGPIIVADTESAAQGYDDHDTTPRISGSFTAFGKTWYYFSGYLMPTSETIVSTKVLPNLVDNYSNVEAAATGLLYRLSNSRPFSFPNFVSINGNTLYRKFNDGFKIMSGRSSQGTITLPSAFTNTYYTVIACHASSTAGSSNAAIAISTTQIKVVGGNSGTYYWMAFGY